jgi:hypothetical protein
MDDRTWTPPTLLGFQVSMACRDRLHPYIRLQAAVDQFLPEPLRKLSAVSKLPPISALSANGLLAVGLHVATSGAPQALGKRQQLGVLA